MVGCLVAMGGGHRAMAGSLLGMGGHRSRVGSHVAM